MIVGGHAKVHTNWYKGSRQEQVRDRARGYFRAPFGYTECEPNHSVKYSSSDPRDSKNS